MMLAIQRKDESKLKVNVLPAKIHYDGPIEVEKKYWAPEHREGKNAAYFRGRELDGNAIEVPEGYKGSILRVTNEVLPKQGASSTQDDDEDETEEVVADTKVAEELGTFDEVMVWNHDVPWDAAEDPYAKGIDEWMSFANAIHSQEEPASDSSSAAKPS